MLTFSATGVYILAYVLHGGNMKSIAGTRTEPTVHIFDSGFKYVNAAQTDIRQTFERARRQVAERGVADGTLSAISVMPSGNRGRA